MQKTIQLQSINAKIKILINNEGFSVFVQQSNENRQSKNLEIILKDRDCN